MADFEPFVLDAFISDSQGSIRPIRIVVEIPVLMPDGSFKCDVHSSMLSKHPHPVYSGLPYDAWAKAFELLRNTLSDDRHELVDGVGNRLSLPSPPRDRSWVPSPDTQVKRGIEPIFRVEGWTKKDGSKTRIELAIWPPFEEERGVFCAPMKCGMRRGGAVMCSYGASPEQAVYLAYGYLRIEIEFREIFDIDGKPLVIPTIPEPPLIEAPNLQG